jgi:hypothetical protein
MNRESHREAWMRIAVALVAVCALGLSSVPASALTASSGWAIDAHSYPTNLAPGGKGDIVIDLYNIGAAPSSGTITVTDTLPPGLTAIDAGELGSQRGIEHLLWDCHGTTVVTCTNTSEGLPSVVPGDGGAIDQIGIAVNVAETSGASSNQVTIAGGGAPTVASASTPVTISSTPAAFGFSGINAWFSNADGTIDTQAGSHPYEAIVSIDLNTVLGEENSANHAGGDVRNIDFNLPPGLIGDPNASPQCTRAQLDRERCPPSTQIGTIAVGLGGFTAPPPSVGHPATIVLNVFNMVPPPGVPAQFAFDILGIHAFLDAGVRSDSDFGITEHSLNIPNEEITYSSIILWGVPADPSHNALRGQGEANHEGCQQGCPSSGAQKPLLTLPTSCSGPQLFTARANTWQDSNFTAEASFLSHDSNGTPTGFTGCDHLSFAPSIAVAPDTSDADTPAGLTVELKVPQEGLLEPEGIATSNIRGTKVTLPAGVVINPGQAAGLQACQPGQDGVGTEEAPSCPAASKVGTVQIETPLLKERLEGNVYVLQSNPPNLQLLVAASGGGVNLKLVGGVHLDEATGQLTTTFENTPELPFTDFKLSFSGGAQAALATPATCGVYRTNSDFTPWSTPFVSDLLTTTGFAIEGGPGGSACVSPLPFSPAMIAGSTTDQAGGYTDFSLLLQRGDGQQRISTLQFKTPEGLLGMISRVPLCTEPQASQGMCSSASQIGHTVVEAGPGPYPLVVPQIGQPPAPIYLTGGYKGAPYGLSIVVPLVVGPFTLQTQVVRGRIEVDPHTARLTVTTDPLPTIINGIPADLRTINAVIDRPGFMFNPTNCAPQSFSGIATSIEGASTPLESHFQMGSCQSLSFKPNFRVSTSGKTSRKEGASLDAKVLYPNAPTGNNQASSQSNIASVKVDLPKQLPSRLTTLQKACTAATFDANPANCPAASLVGHATAITPVLPVPLRGPAYFVSHGGEAFPSLIVVLQGYGVTIDLVGSTFINSKTNITSSTFKQIPDVPITSFDLSLPKGPFSALAANGNLCKSKLTMPTTFTAQDGAVIHQSTPIGVTGCAKAKKKAKLKLKSMRKKK